MWILFLFTTLVSSAKKIESYPSYICLSIYDAFLGIIGNEPSGKYKDRSNHPFHQNIISILFELNIYDETFEKWKKEVIDVFNDKNWSGVNIEKLAVDPQKGMLKAVVWSVK